MVEIKLHIPIGSEEENRWFASFDGEDVVFSLEALQRIFAQNASENDFKFNIHCDGGSVLEGLAIYDALRTSGKNIYTNIEGGCHSMAMVILLAAPFENRTANANARALIHEVQIPVFNTMVSTTELQAMTDEAQREQSAILDIYADRTGSERAVLETLMKEEKVRTASELLKYGFISKINIYNTNSKKRKMNASSKKSFVEKLDKLVSGIKNVLGEPVNYDFTDADGNVILTTEREDETIEVGDSVVLPDGATSGEVALADGRVVVIADGVVAEIKEAGEEDPENEDGDKIAELEERVKTLEEKLAAANKMLVEARNQIASDFAPKGRRFSGKGENALTADQITAQAKSRVKK